MTGTIVLVLAYLYKAIEVFNRNKLLLGKFDMKLLINFKETAFILLGFLTLLLIQCKTSPADLPKVEDINIERVLVGTSKMSITPPEGLGIGMSGFSGQGLFVGVHDELFVRTIVITDQESGETAIHCSIDQLNFRSHSFLALYNRIINEIESLSNLPVSNLFVTATHTHGGPDTTHPLNIEHIDHAIFESIKAASESKQEAKMRVGKTIATNVNTNRQNPHRGFLGNFICSLEVNLDGNSDKEVDIIEFINNMDISIASMITFGVHSTVMGQHNDLLTSDLAGNTSKHIENKKGNNHICLFLYTGGGDQSPVDRTQDGRFIDHPVTGVAAYGERLGSQILPAFENATFIESVSMESIVVPVALQRDWSPQNNQADQMETRAIYGLKYSDDFVIVGTPFELFASTVQEIKNQAPFNQAVILSLTNGVAHYIPPEETYNKMPHPDRPDSLYVVDQCYENRTSIYTSTAEGIFKDQCLELLHLLDN